MAADLSRLLFLFTEKSQATPTLCLSLSVSCSLFYDTSSVLSMAEGFMSAELEIICNKWSWSNRSIAPTFSGGTNNKTMQNLRIASVSAEIQISHLPNTNQNKLPLHTPARLHL